MAVALLNKYPTKVDPIQALMLLPPETLLREMKPFLEVVTKQTLKERKASQIHRNLLSAQKMEVQGQKIRIQQSHKIVVEDTDLCRYCQKRIGKT